MQTCHTKTSVFRQSSSLVSDLRHSVSPYSNQNFHLYLLTLDTLFVKIEVLSITVLLQLPQLIRLAHILRLEIQRRVEAEQNLVHHLIERRRIATAPDSDTSGSTVGAESRAAPAVQFLSARQTSRLLLGGEQTRLTEQVREVHCRGSVLVAV